MTELRDELESQIRGVLDDVIDKGPEATRGTWPAAVQAGLASLVAPTVLGGEELGLAELAVLLRGVGHRAHDLPVWETLACGVLPLVRAGSAEQQSELVPQILDGSLLIAPALSEPGAAIPAAPATRVVDGAVTGTKVRVPTFETTTLLIVSAASEEGAVAAIVDPAGTGVERIDTRSSSGRAEATYRFDGAPAVAVLGAGSGDVLRLHAIAGLVLLADGLLTGARDLTATYIANREQFGRKLAEFQAVAQEIADVYVDSRMVSLAASEVARRLDAGQPVDDDLAIAAYNACERAPRAVQMCHHLHGGMGVDVSYPLHRYSGRIKDVAHLLGGVVGTLEQVPIAEREGKNAELTDAEREFQHEIRTYFEGLVSREDRLELMSVRHGSADRRIIKQMGADGMMGVGWPVEYGGKGLGSIEQQIFANEAARSDIPLPSVTLQTVGPTLQQFGTQKQKDMFLADILAGDVHFAIGYSEPDNGTDLAGLRTSARRDGDHYVVNGQKLWTTGGHAADYVWLAVRTNPDAPKHRGISVLIVDTRDPGYSWTPIITADGAHHVNATYYNDVRVPVDMLVGEENQGWKLITTQLNHERVMLGPAGRLEGLRDLVTDWARNRRTPDGTPVLEVPAVREVLARVTSAFRVNELLNWQVASSSGTGAATVADASASKVFASEVVQGLGRSLEEVVATYGDPADPDTAYLLQHLDVLAKRNYVLTFGGGVNEVQRELIAQFGLGLPKVPR